MRNHPPKLAFLAIIMAAMVSATASYAQEIPGSAQPGRLEEDLILEEDLLPEAEPGMLIETPQYRVNVPAEAFALRFTLNGVEFKDNTVYSADELAEYYNDQLNQEIPFSMMYSLAELLTQKLRNDGYLMSSVVVVPQNVDDGIVELRFLEGFVDQVTYQYESDLSAADKAAIEAIGNKLSGVKPLTVTLLERQLLLINDLPGIEGRAVIAASENTPLAADLTIVITKDDLSGILDVNNRGTRFVGPVVGQAALFYNGAFGVKNQLGLRTSTATTTDEFQFLELSFERMINDDGLKASLTGSLTASEPGHTLDDFEVESNSQNVEARISYPLMRARAQNVEIYSTFSWRNVVTDSLGVKLNEDRIRALRAGLLWNKADENRGVNSAFIEISQGLTILDHTEESRNDTTRAAAAPNFTKIEGSFSREQYLGSGGLSVFAAARGQLSNQALYASEEFGIGGEAFGGAYDSSEITGDQGAAMRLEARYRDSSINHPWVNSLQFYAYYDAGFTIDQDPLAGEDGRRSISSLGSGVRFDLENDVSGYVEVAKPLSRTVSALNNAGDSPRFFFRLTRRF